MDQSEAKTKFGTGQTFSYAQTDATTPNNVIIFILPEFLSLS